jgi:hypothetical protein
VVKITVLALFEWYSWSVSCERVVHGDWHRVPRFLQGLSVWQRHPRLPALRRCVRVALAHPLRDSRLVGRETQRGQRVFRGGTLKNTWEYAPGEPL